MSLLVKISPVFDVLSKILLVFDVLGEMILVFVVLSEMILVFDVLTCNGRSQVFYVVITVDVSLVLDVLREISHVMQSMC